jgi:alanine racemase
MMMGAPEAAGGVVFADARDAATPRVTATVDLEAVRHNLGRVRAFAPRVRVMAAIKADAYGHGALPVAGALVQGGVDALAVACLEEALNLREAGITAPIVLLEGVLSAEEARLALALALQIVVHDEWQLALLSRIADQAQPAIWFKLDTGMHRLGFSPDAAPQLAQRLARQPDWRFCGWMTHLASADETGLPQTSAQLARFEQALHGLSGPRSIANSAGLIAWPQARADWVRPGVMLYGASPLPQYTAAALDLMPAMTLESRVIATKRVAAGESIGYGATYRCASDLPVGVVAIGYADGYPRALPSGTPVLIHGRRVPLVGRVSMDMIAVDLSAVPQTEVGDRVRLWGPELPAEEIAARAGTLAYELFCGLTRRVHFSYAGRG